jgi:hypothetical protein
MIPGRMIYWVGGRGGNVMTEELGARNRPFALEEATIDELHAAITSGQTTCVEIVQHYLARLS